MKQTGESLAWKQMNEDLIQYNIKNLGIKRVNIIDTRTELELYNKTTVEL